MANDYLRIACRRCHALVRLYSYYPSLPTLAAYDVRAFIDAHMSVCYEPQTQPEAVSLGDVPPFEIHTDGSYGAAYGAIPHPKARLPDGKWREDPPEHPGLVAELRESYRVGDREGRTP